MGLYGGFSPLIVCMIFEYRYETNAANTDVDYKANQNQTITFDLTKKSKQKAIVKY